MTFASDWYSFLEQPKLIWSKQLSHDEARLFFPYEGFGDKSEGGSNNVQGDWHCRKTITRPDKNAE